MRLSTKVFGFGLAIALATAAAQVNSDFIVDASRRTSEVGQLSGGRMAGMVSSLSCIILGNWLQMNKK